MPKFFVWINGMRGPEAQLWAEKQVDGGGKAKPTLFIRELTAIERSHSLDSLAMRYPHA